MCKGASKWRHEAPQAIYSVCVFVYESFTAVKFIGVSGDCACPRLICTHVLVLAGFILCCLLYRPAVHSRPSSDLARKMEDIQNQINALTDDELMNPSAKLTFVPSPSGALGVPARLQSHSGAASMQTPHDAMQGVGQRLVQSSLHGGGTSAAGNGAGSGYTAAGNASGGQNRLAPGNHAGTGLASSGTLSGASRPISGQIQHMQFAMASIQEDPMLHSGTHGRPSVQHSIGSSMVLSRVGSANLQGRALPRDMPVEDREANVYRVSL